MYYRTTRILLTVCFIPLQSTIAQKSLQPGLDCYLGYYGEIEDTIIRKHSTGIWNVLHSEGGSGDLYPEDNIFAQTLISQIYIISKSLNDNT